jgi:pSer/pThr/pTyr-binding forkhead associated (FHA) protein
MVVRFSVRAGRKSAQVKNTEGDAWLVVDVALVDGQITIGRKPGSAIELPFPAVSACHARLFRRDDGYHIEDLDSANGTHLGQRRLLPRTALPIVAGEVIDVAGIGVRFDGELPSDELALQGGTDTLARRLVHDVFAACPPGETVRLVGVEGPGTGHDLQIACFARPLIVGRGESCDLVLCDEDVSREHGAIARSGAGVTLRDLDSKNGIKVQGRRISGSCRLRDGDVVRIGQSTFRLLDPEDRYLRQIQAAEAQGDPSSPDPSRSTTVPLTAPRSDGETASEAEVASEGSPAPASSEPGGKRLPAFATAVGVLVLLCLLGLVLALAFGCQV